MPYPWQVRLYERFLAGRLPDRLDIPTGLGKSSVMALWLIARARGAPVPRRLVYVVDRRAIVDQATDLATRIALALGSESAIAARIRAGLGLGPGETVAVSTLRGRFADNRLWLEDPTRPAIVVGTVDMIGSRLLFQGYGVGRRARSVHAGLIAHDTLVVLDEAHLSPAFARLLAAATDLGPVDDAALPPRLTVMALSATAASTGRAPFALDAADRTDDRVRRRLAAPKPITILADDGLGALDAALASRAWDAADEGRAALRVVVYCDRRDTARKVHAALEKRIAALKKAGGAADLVLMTGERRVKEREALADHPAMRRFRDGTRPDGAVGPAFLVATSAGEVGVDLDADAMVSDLVAYERTVQRLGRVNRRGEAASAPVVVVAPPGEAKGPDDVETRRRRLAALLALPPLPDGTLDGSIEGLRLLAERAEADPAVAAVLAAATTPDPLAPPLTTALLEAWSLTGLKQHTGRPDAIDPWLRGWVDDEPQMRVAWRRYLPWPAETADADAALLDRATDFFEAAPIHPSETLEAPVHRVVQTLQKRLAGGFHRPRTAGDADAAPTGRGLRPGVLFVLADDGEAVDGRRADELARVLATPRELEKLKRAWVGRTLVLDAALGGLDGAGLLTEAAPDAPVPTIDGDLPRDDDASGWTAADRADVGFTVSVRPAANETARGTAFRLPLGDEDATDREALVVELRPADLAARADAALSGRAQSLVEHTTMIVEEAERLSGALGLGEPHRRMLAAAARLHDRGKDVDAWQDAMGAPKAGRPFAKTENPRFLGDLGGYRHEFGSLVEALDDDELAALPDDLRDLALHLVAAHHGHARPTIRAVLPSPRRAGPGTPARRSLPPSMLLPVATEAALRFARLQRRWGPWGLAWWEAVFRAADWAASRRNERRGTDGETA